MEREPLLTQLKSPAFWEEVWGKAKEESIFRRKRKSLKDTVDYWNRRAEGFEKNVMGEKGEKRVLRVLNWLESQGVILDNIKVLDIGAGPGPFALAFAERAREVVALEPAEAMTDFLRKEMRIHQRENIRIIQDTWEEVNIQEQQLKGNFDLVFASMSPGINNWETIQKALDCSKKYCYISSFAGKRQSDAIVNLWQTLFGEEIPAWPGDIIFILNLLYARGYQLSFRVWEERRKAENTPKEAVSGLLEELQHYGIEEFAPEEKVKQFVENNVVDGVFRQDFITCLGQILIKL